jgi:lipopolysaccharide export system permease protein
LARYVAKLFIIRFLVFLLGLVSVLQVLDLMSNSEAIMAPEGATFQSLLDYLALRIPQLISQFTPFAALLGAVATLATLNQHSEVIVMKGAGLSAYHVIAPTILICTFISIGHFFFHETVVIKANAKLDYWEKNDFALDLKDPPTTANRSWMLDGSTIIEVDSIVQSGRVLLLDNVSLYERDANANLQSLAKARFATYTDGVWTLFEVTRFSLPGFTTVRSDSEPWSVSIPAERFIALAIEPQKVNYTTLKRSIRDLSREGYPTDVLRSALYHKIAGPLATILMPLLGAVAAFGLARGGQLFIRIIFGMALGFAFFVADNFMLAVGEFGAIPPLLSAWAPFILFLLLGLSVLFYTEE